MSVTGLTPQPPREEEDEVEGRLIGPVEIIEDDKESRESDRSRDQGIVQLYEPHRPGRRRPGGVPSFGRSGESRPERFH